jgi:pimeloyl-ACP methyl ester carboxylesterase
MPVMRRRPLALPVALTLLVGGVLAGCSGSDDVDSAPTTVAAGVTTTTAADGDGAAVSTTPLLEAPTGTLADAECWWDLAEIDPTVTVSCHTLTVPADWANPEDGDEVVLPIARLHKEGVAEDAPPIVVLHGGPGGDLLDAAPVGTSEGEVVPKGDVILWDQRGAGRAVPSLDCPEKEEAVMAALTTTDPVEVELKRNVDATQACRDRLVGEGIDLNDYNTHASVNDMEALRVALGVDTWNVQGGSYGTRIGLAYARQHPDPIRALVLDSVYPPQVGDLQRTLDMAPDAIGRLVDECTADAACSAAYPDLGATLDEAAASLDESPGEATLALEYAGQNEERTYRVTGSDLRSGMFAALYDTSIIPLLPSVIGGVAEGDRSIVPTFLETATPRLTGLSEGAYLSVDCADSGRLLDGASAEDIVGDGDHFIYAMVLAQPFCAQWDVTPLPASFNEPALPEVPTIVFGGTLDPVTPFTDSQEQAEAMADARFVRAPRGGHGVTGFDDCTRQAYLGFLDDPTSDLPACTADIAVPPFTL